MCVLLAIAIRYASTLPNTSHNGFCCTVLDRLYVYNTNCIDGERERESTGIKKGSWKLRNLRAIGEEGKREEGRLSMPWMISDNDIHKS